MFSYFPQSEVKTLVFRKISAEVLFKIIFSIFPDEFFQFFFRQGYKIFLVVYIPKYTGETLMYYISGNSAVYFYFFAFFEFHEIFTEILEVTAFIVFNVCCGYFKRSERFEFLHDVTVDTVILFHF